MRFPNTIALKMRRNSCFRMWNLLYTFTGEKSTPCPSFFFKINCYSLFLKIKRFYAIRDAV